MYYMMGLVFVIGAAFAVVVAFPLLAGIFALFGAALSLMSGVL